MTSLKRIDFRCTSLSNKWKRIGLINKKQEQHDSDILKNREVNSEILKTRELNSEILQNRELNSEILKEQRRTECLAKA